ncbi:hypothetical protein ACHAXT_009848 [Thalassiosira profunda]
MRTMALSLRVALLWAALAGSPATAAWTDYFSRGTPGPSPKAEATANAAGNAREFKKKAPRGGARLLDERHVNRGAEGTVTKDMDRGPPLKVNLPEDEDDGWDDDEWWEDDQDKTFEQKQLEAKDAQAKTEKEGNAGDATPAESAAAEGEEEEDSSDDSSDDEDEEEEKAPTPKSQRIAKKEVPRKRESNAAAVMKVIDSDANPDFKVDANGRVPAVEEDSEDSEDSSDDEDAAPVDRTTYLPLPNLAQFTPDEAAHRLLDSSGGVPFKLQKRLASMFEKATSHECRAKIAEHMALFVNGLAEETKFPFEDFHYPNTCQDIPRYGDWDHLPEGVKIQDVQYRTYQPPKDEVPEGTYLENTDELQLLYVILTHDQPEATIRLMESVYVPGVTKYVIHVDGKEKADPTYNRLVEYAKEKNEGREEYIRVVPTEKRVRVNWGGYSMVEATLVALKAVFGLDYYESHPGVQGGDDPDNPHAFTFHKLLHLASTTYPLASNTEIRDTLASYPLDANFLHIILRPNNPTPSVWNYFVECDDALHRIYRIPALNFDRGNGVDIYTSSQWFIASREFAWYLASPPKDSFVESYLEYIEHVVVADEAFFGTVIRNTHFCSTLHNDNFLHLQFDRWENEATGKRDQRKCVMKNRDHCGRSPTTLTVDYLPTLELSGDLFARKFDDVKEPLIKNYIDNRRQKDEERFKREAELKKEMTENGTEASLPLEEWEFQGEGVLIVAKETVHDDVPLCMGLAKEGNKVLLQPCFKDDVPPTLSAQWEAGAVIIEEIEGLNRWDIGPCSSDGTLKRNETGELEMIPGEYSDRGPSCGIKLGDGPRAGRCLDVQSEKQKPGGLLHVYPCYTRWHQLFSFGNGTIAPRGAVHASLPLHIVNQQKKKKPEKEAYHHLCFGVVGRGDADESEWIKWTEEEMNQLDPWEHDDAETYPNGRKSLQLWKGEQLQTTPCSNTGAVIEWYFVPFIVEEYDDEAEEGESEEATADDSEL